MPALPAPIARLPAPIPHRPSALDITQHSIAITPPTISTIMSPSPPHNHHSIERILELQRSRQEEKADSRSEKESEGKGVKRKRVDDNDDDNEDEVTNKKDDDDETEVICAKSLPIVTTSASGLPFHAFSAFQLATAASALEMDKRHAPSVLFLRGRSGNSVDRFPALSPTAASGQCSPPSKKLCIPRMMTPLSPNSMLHAASLAAQSLPFGLGLPGMFPLRAANPGANLAATPYPFLAVHGGWAYSQLSTNLNSK